MDAILATVRIFAILLSNRGNVQAALEKLNKRAERKGLPLLSFSWGKAYTEAVRMFYDSADDAPAGARLIGGREYSVDISRIPLTLDNAIPKYEGWSFVAALQHLDGENIVRAMPGKTVPPSFRNRGSACDHCKVDRRRIDTYVLSHEDGRHVQVGSTCIADFLGSDDAGKIASQATLLADAASLAEGGESEGGGSASNDRTLGEFLGWVAFIVREDGWVSRTAARDGKGAASADKAFTLMIDGKARKDREKATGVKCEPSEADLARASEGEVWAESLPDETVNAQPGDYLHNIRAIARSGLVTFRTGGLGGSILVAYDRAMGRARERARAQRVERPTLDAYVGNVGDKVTFGAKPKKGQVTLSTDPVTLDFVTGYQSAYGYTTIVKFRTNDGAIVVWYATNTEIGRGDVGKTYTLTGTIKKHDTYKGAKQTVMTRCCVTEVAAESVAA